MPAVVESKAQVEATKLKNKIIEVENHLKESKKLSAKLRETMEKKLQQISVVDGHIAEQIETFRWRKAEILQERKFIEDINKTDIDGLKAKTARIIEEISSFDIVQFENDHLHLKMKDISAAQYQNIQRQILEKEKRKQKDFDARMALEEIMRKMIKNSDADYKRAAIEKMNEEAAQAYSENQRILAEFSIRERQAVSLVKQQSQSFNKLQKLRVERDVSASAIQYQRKQLTRLMKINENQLDDTDEMEELLASMKQDIFDLKLKVDRKREAKLEVERLQHLLSSVEAKGKTFHDCATFSAHELLQQMIAAADRITAAQNEAMSKLVKL